MLVVLAANAVMFRRVSAAPAWDVVSLCISPYPHRIKHGVGHRCGLPPAHQLLRSCHLEPSTQITVTCQPLGRHLFLFHLCNEVMLIVAVAGTSSPNLIERWRVTGCCRVDVPSGDVRRHPASTCSYEEPLCEDFLLHADALILGRQRN